MATMINRAYTAWLLVMIALTAGAGCTAVHHQPATDDQWEVPRSFERDEDAEDEELIFALHHDGDGISATIRRTIPAYPDPLLPHAIALRANRPGESETGVERSESSSGWLASWSDDEKGRWTHVYAFSGAEASYFMVVAGPGESGEQHRELFDELLAGFTPAEAPQTDTAIPTPQLVTGLAEPLEVQLEPVDVDGEPRLAVQRDVAFAHLMSTGHLLHEPLTFAVDASSYLELLLKRLNADGETTPIDIEDCSSDCAAIRWTTPTDEGRVHNVGATIIDDEAYQIRLSAPRDATELEDLQRQWLAEFLSQPLPFFTDDSDEGGLE